MSYLAPINSVQTRGIVKKRTSADLQGVCVNLGDLENLKPVLEFLENGGPERIKTLQKNVGKVDFSEPRLLQCTRFAYN